MLGDTEAQAPRNSRRSVNIIHPLYASRDTDPQSQSPGFSDRVHEQQSGKLLSPETHLCCCRTISGGCFTVDACCKNPDILDSGDLEVPMKHLIQQTEASICLLQLLCLGRLSSLDSTQASHLFTFSTPLKPVLFQAQGLCLCCFLSSLNTDFWTYVLYLNSTSLGNPT